MERLCVFINKMVTMNIQAVSEFGTEVYLWCSNCKSYLEKSKIPLINKCRKCPSCNQYQTLKQITFKHSKETRTSIRHAAIQREHKRILKYLLNA
jgi:hypothetical protein